MSLIREKVRFNGKNMDFKFTLDSHDNFTGFQQEIDSLTEVVTLDVVNPATDLEVRKFKMNPTPSTNITLTFQFSAAFIPTFIAAGFTLSAVTYNNSDVQNSFFILDFYDTFDVNSQTKIFTTYLTKIGTVPIYTIGAANNNQFYNWYVPLSYITAQTGTTVTGYTKFSFYNAKTGIVTLFNNSDNLSLTTAERIFFKTQLNLAGMTWKFVSPNYPTLIAKEIISSTAYITKVNNTVVPYNDMEQTYPSGNTYNYVNNNYITS